MTHTKRKEKSKKKRKSKKKLTCCQRCRRRIRRWIYRRIKRCCKKAIFGVPDPKISDYEIAGVNLADAKDKLTRKKSKSIKVTPEKKNTSVITLYKNKKKSIISIPFKKALLEEYEDISLIKPKRSKIKSLMNDLKERNLYIGLSKDSKLNLTKSEKEKFRKKANEYEEKYKKGSYLKDFEDKYKKGSYLKDFDEKYKKGSYLKDVEEKYKKGSYLKDFEEKYKKSSYLKDNEEKYKTGSFLDLKLLEKMDKDEIKKKFSITSSKHGVLKAMLSDYKKKNFSLTGIFSKSKIDADKLDKEKLQKLLQLYKEKDTKKKSYTFVKQSKIKQLKSDLRAKLANMY